RTAPRAEPEKYTRSLRVCLYRRQPSRGPRERRVWSKGAAGRSRPADPVWFSKPRPAGRPDSARSAQTMNNSIPRHENGNGAIGGRGVQRRKMTLGQRISLGADVALGLAQVDPSIAQSAAIVGVSPAQISAEIKARAKAREDAERAKREA